MPASCLIRTVTELRAVLDLPSLIALHSDRDPIDLQRARTLVRDHRRLRDTTPLRDHVARVEERAVPVLPEQRIDQPHLDTLHRGLPLTLTVLPTETVAHNVPSVFRIELHFNTRTLLATRVGNRLRGLRLNTHAALLNVPENDRLCADAKNRGLQQLELQALLSELDLLITPLELFFFFAFSSLIVLGSMLAKMANSAKTGISFSACLMGFWLPSFFGCLNGFAPSSSVSPIWA